MNKVTACRVPRIPTDAQKQTGLNISRASLELLQKDPDSFLTRFATMDETWFTIHRFAVDMAAIRDDGFGILEYALYLPDLVPSDF
ncbi:hypothetical protein EVAR_27225_1 [Eumeta japonica]|uniref:Uncharacterized protein n=1 Tax=Eumeta variegata TaxID=151549 RepID=A0A4C1VWY7_EUMVA|nr:hypothetical protein EVAR_27225_1 [Eumeta japonica]